MHRYDPTRSYPDAAADPGDAALARQLRVPPRFHDDAYVRPIHSRYVDPLELVWLATARRLALHVRRDPAIFSMTDGTGLLALSPRDDLDEDDCLAQMVLHELCHWITNGVEAWHERDWGFPLWDEVDLREHACLRLQCWLASRWGLREMFGPTGGFRQYYDQLPADPLAAIDDSAWEQATVRLAAQAVARAQGLPWWPALSAAMQATADLRAVIDPFLDDYASEHADDPLPPWWGRRHPADPTRP